MIVQMLDVGLGLVTVLVSGTALLLAQQDELRSDGWGRYATATTLALTIAAGLQLIAVGVLK